MPTFFEQALASVDRSTHHKASDEFWRKDDPIFNAEGKLVRGGMFPHQRRWWQLESFIKILVGGYGAGKTAIIAKRAISSALHNAPVPVALVSPTYNIARNTTLAALAENCVGKRSLLGKKFYFRYNETTHEFRINWRGREAKVILYSGDNPMSLRGPNLAAGYIDEPFMQEEEVFHQIVARVRHPAATMLEIGMTGTPDGGLDWGYELAEGEMSQRHDVQFIRAASYENLATGSRYIDRLRASFTDRAGRAFVEGHFINLSTGLVYYGFDIAENIFDLEPPPGCEWGVGMDFNVNPMAAVVFWRRGDHMHIVQEIEAENADTEYMCDLLREKYGDKVRDVWPDASGRSRNTSSPGGRSDFYYIRKAGFNIHCREENPHRRDRYNAVNGKLKPGGDGRITLTISGACRKIKKYFLQYTHERMHTPKHRAMSHLLDALGYPVAYMFPVDRESFAVRRLRGA